MKTIAIVAEYNPLHFGHLKQLEYVKNTLKADNVIVLMSGSFTQRGEPAVLDKYKRAKHAVIAGVDTVIELPTVFATANAEIFAKGAMKILDSIGNIDGICFGAESGEKEDFIRLAKLLNDESKEYKKALKELLDEGVSLAKAKFEALKRTGVDFDEKLVTLPNNILGIEYTKALLALNSKIEIYPLIREGDHNSTKFDKSRIASARSIRESLKTGKKRKTKRHVPSFVYKDLKEYPYLFDKLIMAKALLSPSESIAKTPDCSEGLENRIKSLAVDNKSMEVLLDKVCTKRYTKSRINRILTANFLGITKDFVDKCLKKSNLYAKVIAVNSSNQEILPLIKKDAMLPVITRRSDLLDLDETAKECYALDVTATDVYFLITDNGKNDNQMSVI